MSETTPPPETGSTAPSPTQDPQPCRQQAGLVIVNYGKSQLIEDNGGNLHRCVARRNLKQIVCGDRITWESTGKREGVITAIKPRQTVLNRVDGAQKTRPLAANIDQIIIVTTTQPAFDSFLVDKYTVAAELAGIPAVLVVNKSDLFDTPTRRTLEASVSDYVTLGYPALFTSATRNTGIDCLSDLLAGKTGILVGQSGVGKSSLIKRLLPNLEIAIGKLSEASAQGRHTTTTTTLYHLPHGGKLIDSPGVRDFRLGHTRVGELSRGFREFPPWLGHCRFNNCRHLGEPDCAVSAAAERGEISIRRLESYRQLAS